MRWGLGQRINARTETLRANGFPWQRCAIFADSSYEWRKDKTPFRFTLSDSEPFAFAGIWHPYDDGPHCAIVTCPANSVVAKIHDRMPVILNKHAIKRWLEPGRIDSKDAAAILLPYDSESMRSVEVSRRLNSARYDDADLLTPDVAQPSFGFWPEIPNGATAREVETILEIAKGKGEFSLTVEVPLSNLRVPTEGALTSGQALQMRLLNGVRVP